MAQRWSKETACPKCGLTYADALAGHEAGLMGHGLGPALKYQSPPGGGEKLRVTCLCCGHGRDVPCADDPGLPDPGVEGGDVPSEGEKPPAPSGPGRAEAPPKRPGRNETPAAGAFAQDRNVKTTDVPMGGGKEHLPPG